MYHIYADNFALILFYIYIHMYIILYIYICVCIYIYTYILFMLFTTEVYFEVAIESWLEWDLNPRPLNSVQAL